MDTEKILLRKIMQLPKPEINKLVNQINTYWHGQLPSTSQLQRFRSYIQNHNLDDIKNFLERYQTEIPENPWGKKNSRQGDQSLAGLFLDIVINKTNGINTLNINSNLWGADFFGLFDSGRFDPLTLNDASRLQIARKIMTDILDTLLLRSQGKNQYLTIYYDDDGLLEVSL